MKKSCFIRESLMAFCLCLIVSSAFAQSESTKEQFSPQSGQEGKDVVWVPTPNELVEKMLDLAEVTSKDYLIDLGSGDGRTVIAAGKRGAKALGVEFNPKMVELSKQNAEDAGVSNKVRFVEGDLFEADLSEATVITLFLLNSINLKLRPKLLDLNPGTRIVTNTFDMGEWEPDETATIEGNESSWDTALLWIIPAKVEGAWQLPQGKLTLKQDFQMITGSLETKGSNSQITDGKLLGNQISFTLKGSQYTGIVNANKIEGTVTTREMKNKWSATLITKK